MIQFVMYKVSKKRRKGSSNFVPINRKMMAFDEMFLAVASKQILNLNLVCIYFGPTALAERVP